MTDEERQIRDAYIDGFLDGTGVFNPDDPDLKAVALESWYEHNETGPAPQAIPMVRQR